MEIRVGAARKTSHIFYNRFGAEPAITIADTNIFRAVGPRVADAFKTSGYPMLEPFVFRAPDLNAEHRFVAELENGVKETHGYSHRNGFGYQ